VSLNIVVKNCLTNRQTYPAGNTLQIIKNNLTNLHCRWIW